MASCKYCGKRETAMEVVCRDCTENMERVVYCKDCVYMHKGVCGVFEGMNGMLDDTDFCSRGRIKEEKR